MICTNKKIEQTNFHEHEKVNTSALNDLLLALAKNHSFMDESSARVMTSVRVDTIHKMRMRNQ